MRRIARLAVCVALTALTAAAPAEAALPPIRECMVKRILLWTAADA